MKRLVLSGIWMLVSLASFAQFKNVVVDPGQSDKGPYEPTIAINLNNPKNIVAVSALNNVYYSSNGGSSWNKSEIYSLHGTGGNPLLISDFKGSFYYFHLPEEKKVNAAAQIVVQESLNGGITWSQGTAIVGVDSTKNRFHPRAVVDRKGNWYATWSLFDKYGSSDPGCQSVVLMSTSSNGKKWSKPVQVSQTAGDCLNQGKSAVGATPAVTGDGSKVFIAWSNQNKIYFDRSFDGGKMWLSTDIAIAQQGGVNFQVPGLKSCEGLPLLVCDNSKRTNLSGALYIVWSDQTNGPSDTDIWFIRSMNFGDNWTYPLRVNNDEMGKHQFLPAVAVDGASGFIYIVYYDRRNYEDAQTDVYLAYSTDAGTTFRNVKISETPFTPTDNAVFGNYISISADKGVITPIWTRMDEGRTSILTAVIQHEELEKIK